MWLDRLLWIVFFVSIGVGMYYDKRWRRGFEGIGKVRFTFNIIGAAFLLGLIIFGIYLGVPYE